MAQNKRNPSHYFKKSNWVWIPKVKAAVTPTEIKTSHFNENDLTEDEKIIMNLPPAVRQIILDYAEEQRGHSMPFGRTCG